MGEIGRINSGIEMNYVLNINESTIKNITPEGRKQLEKLVKDIKEIIGNKDPIKLGNPDKTQIKRINNEVKEILKNKKDKSIFGRIGRQFKYALGVGQKSTQTFNSITSMLKQLPKEYKS